LARLGEITEEHFDKTFNTTSAGCSSPLQKATAALSEKRGAVIPSPAQWYAIRDSPPAQSTTHHKKQGPVRSFARNLDR